MPLVANPPLPWPRPPPARDHDGRVTLEDLYCLAELCLQRSKHYQNFEFAAQMRGYCTLLLWQAMCAPGGQHTFVQW